MMITPQTIQALRKKLGLTQLEFAARIGVDPVTISRWERGISRPTSRAHLRALADIAEPPARLEKKGIG